LADLGEVDVSKDVKVDEILNREGKTVFTTLAPSLEKMKTYDAFNFS
jgi:hypothetical protein